MRISKKVILAVICLIGFSVPCLAQTENTKLTSLGVVNDKAKILPMPQVPPTLLQPRIAGNVNVQVKINLQKGDIVWANAISGNSLLRPWAEKSARQAKFEPILKEFDTIYAVGILIYKLEDINGKTIENKKPKPLLPILSSGIANGKAIHLPRPPIPSGGTLRRESIVGVSVIVDMDGIVILAQAISGHPLLYQVCENAARNTKFSPTLIHGPRIFVKALLVYKFKPGTAIETNIKRNDIDVISTPINLVKPPFISCNCRFGSSPTVFVQAEIDGQGNVTKVTAISGHAILRQTSEKAAHESKFLPINIKTKLTIAYYFEEVDKWSVKASNIEIKNVTILE